MSAAANPANPQLLKPLYAAAFSADITPPIGEPLCYALQKVTAILIEHPLAAKGVVLRQGETTVVLCALDLCSLANDADWQFRKRLARAARTTPARVAAQSLHLHTVPGINPDLTRLATAPDALCCGTAEYFETVTRKTAAAVSEAVARLEPVTHIGHGWAAVDRVASSRRIRTPDGNIMPRYSCTEALDEFMAPEGLIDGFVRTVAFHAGDRMIAQLHYYATHPQSFYGDGHVTCDVPGLARARLEQETGVPQIYFTGCSGNVTMGKYNNGSPECRAELAQRLYDGMARATKAIKREPAGEMAWKVVRVRFPYSTAAADAAEPLQQTLLDPARSVGERVRAAWALGYAERVRSRRPFELSCLSLGPVRTVHLPGEPFVEYQLWAQRVAADRFLAVAGYGDGAMGYICTDEAFTDRGGYEQTWAFAGRCERVLKNAIKRLLAE